ncbi:SDR family oxidoreductase [Rhodomicrobium vannielii ATCC 17100]|uniref:SDR family oxidoreductase n=1 Tax=Rhodomicrobium vannielii TaxID=1069 RepID=UPI0019186DBF|nr:SDR family oxidoreductase [Rhodomicrobium vannielii]MBJ7534478.1 SDR family oxidoreductase [Rhodomicrobium vannielii ATCC 17100]
MSEAGSYRSIFRPGLFAGQVHIVTGGGTGIGRCTAHELASLGATLVLVGRKEDRLAATAAEIAEDGGTASHAVCDIRDEDAVRALVSGIVARHGRIHGLVNNAGGQFPAPLMAIPKKGFDAVVATNLTGGFLMMREVFTQSMRADGGAIVNMAADMWNGMPGMGHSGAARAGMVNLTKTAAFEWGFAGVRVNAVAPGWIASSGMDRYEGPVKALIPKLKDHVPLRRLGTEAEVSAAICFLLSEGAAFINGTTIQIDGGAPLGNPLFDMGTSPPTHEFNGFHRAAKPKVLDSKDES